MAQIFKLPDVGEGLTEAEIVSVKVAPGDTVSINDILFEVETAKSVVELSSPFEGTVETVHVSEGETVEVESPLVTISGGQDGAGSAESAPAADTAAAGSTPAGGESQKILVGNGPSADPVKRRARKKPAKAAPAPSPAPAPVNSAPVQQSSAQVEAQHERKLLRGSLGESLGGLTEKASALLEERLRKNSSKGEVADRPVGSIPRRPTLAKPPVRKAAQDMGIDLAHVTPTGGHGQVTKRDLLNYAAHVRDADTSSEAPTAETPDSFWIPAGAGGDRIERIKVRGVRKATAKAMVNSAFTAPHVSIFVDVDASRTMEFVKRLKKSRHFEGVKVTPLLILAKAVIWATARNPQVNATWTDSEILIKHFMNLGIAAATPRGLMVPNIKDAQDLSLRELALALNELTVRAREGKTQPAEMSQGTMTITNIGALGIDTGTPIINPGEVAIIAFGTIKQKPWVVDGEVIPRWVTTLGGSFDHRVVDGDLSARFMADVAAVLEEPALLLDE